MTEQLNQNELEVIDPVEPDMELTEAEIAETTALSQRMQVNHDLSTLFLIARTQLGFEFLNSILYGDFEDVPEEDIEQAKEVIEKYRGSGAYVKPVEEASDSDTTEVVES